MSPGRVREVLPFLPAHQIAHGNLPAGIVDAADMLATSCSRRNTRPQFPKPVSAGNLQLRSGQGVPLDACGLSGTAGNQF
jgi:hypothetical protein